MCRENPSLKPLPVSHESVGGVRRPRADLWSPLRGPRVGFAAPPRPPVPLTGVGFFDCFRLKPMIRNQLAKHLGFITRKGRGLFLVVKERADVSATIHSTTGPTRSLLSRLGDSVSPHLDSRYSDRRSSSARGECSGRDPRRPLTRAHATGGRRTYGTQPISPANQASTQPYLRKLSQDMHRRIF